MIGLRAGLAVGPKGGIAGGVGADQLGGSGRLIIGMTGQSNSVGFADINSATLKATYQTAYANVPLKQQTATNATPTVWTSFVTAALQPRSNLIDPGHNMGAELSMGRYIDARRSQAWAICKSGAGDTSLANYWRPGAAVPMYADSVAFMRAAESEIGGRLAVMVFNQGEHDATVLAEANAYETNLTAMIAGWRSTWSGLPFIIIKLHNSNTGTYKTTIRTAQTNVANNVSGVTLISVDDLALQGDGLHLTADSYVTLGNRIGLAICQALHVNTLIASFTTSPTGLTVNVTDTSTDDDGSVVGWSYNWGDGTARSTTQNPSHTYAADGTYLITLVATDNTGGTSSYSANVTVVAPTWASDATSGKGVPNDATEWAAIVSAFSLAMGSPNHLWLCQEASGNLADTIGGKTLTAGNTPGHQQAVTGWSRKAVGHSGAASGQTFNNTTMANLNASSVLVLAYIKFNQSTVATRSIMFHGVSAGNDFQSLVSSNSMRLRSGGNIGNSASSHVGQVRPFVLLYDRANSRNCLFSDIEKLSVTFGAVTGAEFRLTCSLSTDTSADAQVLYVAHWEGTAAERSDAEIKALLTALGWSVSGY